MVSSNKTPTPNPAFRLGDQPTPSKKSMTMGQHVLDNSAEMMQSLKPMKQMSQHVCTFALYSHDMTFQIETHHYITRLNHSSNPEFGQNLRQILPELLETRDAKYNISTDALKTSRVDIAEPEWINPQADYWKLHGKGFAVDIKQTKMKKITPFP
ncbi:hypothetical protein EV2_024812 [Malus domestica]